MELSQIVSRIKTILQNCQTASDGRYLPNDAQRLELGKLINDTAIKDRLELFRLAEIGNTTPYRWLKFYEQHTGTNNLFPGVPESTPQRANSALNDNQAKRKLTVYVTPAALKKLKYAAVEQDTTLSQIVESCIMDL